MQNPLTLYCPQAYPPPIPSLPMHALPLFYPTHAHPPPILSHLMNALCLVYPSPHHACLPPILSHPMHAHPLFNPSPSTPSPYSILAHAHPPPILSHPIGSPYFYPSLYIPPKYSTVFYFIPAHACPPVTHILKAFLLSVLTPDSEYATFESAHNEHVHHFTKHQFINSWTPECLLFFIHMNSPPHHIYIT